MDTIHIVLCTDKNYAQHAGVTIASILHNKRSSNPIIFHILHDSLPQYEFENLKQITDKHGATIISHAIDPDSFTTLPMNRYLSKAAYYRLTVTDILQSSIEKVLYLDVDLIVLSDISELWNTDISAHYVGAVEDIGVDNKIGLREKLSMPPQEPYFNSGVLLINLTKWRADSVRSKVLTFIQEHAGKIHFADQDGLNATLWGKWVSVHPKWNVYKAAFRKYYKLHEQRKLPNEFVQAVKEPSIVHFTGPHKPWHSTCLMPYVQEYYFYLAMTPWKGYKAPPASLHQLYRNYRQKLRRYIVDLLD